MSEMNLPDGWSICKLGDVTFIAGGAAFPLTFQGKTDGELPFFKVSDMNLEGNEIRMSRANNYVTTQVATKLKAKVFPPSAIIFPKIGQAVHTNKKCILRGNAIVDNNVMGVWLRDNEAFSSEFLYYFFLNVNLSSLSRLGTLPSITAEAVREISFIFPEKPEQNAIARALRAVQEAKAARQKELAFERERKAALMQHLFAYGTRGEARKQTEIGEMPESWTTIKFGDVIGEGIQNTL